MPKIKGHFCLPSDPTLSHPIPSHLIPSNSGKALALRLVTKKELKNESYQKNVTKNLIHVQVYIRNPPQNESAIKKGFTKKLNLLQIYLKNP